MTVEMRTPSQRVEIQYIEDPMRGQIRLLEDKMAEMKLPILSAAPAPAKRCDRALMEAGLCK
jgi:hypothetical protein